MSLENEASATQEGIASPVVDDVPWPACTTYDATTDHLHLWTAKPTGNDTLDFERGIRMAHEAITFGQQNESPQFLAHVLLALIQSGRLSALERGFIARVGIAAAAGLLN